MNFWSKTSSSEVQEEEQQQQSSKNSKNSSSNETYDFRTVPSSYHDPQRKILVAVGDRLSVPEHREILSSKDRRIPTYMTEEQAAVQAELNPLALKEAIKRNETKRRLQYLVVDSLEVDLVWGIMAAGSVGIFAVPLTKFAVDTAAVNRLVYTETQVGATTSVFTAATPSAKQAASASATTAAAKKGKFSNPVAGNTFHSVISTGQILSFGNAMEKMRAQQLRLGFFSIWRGTGAEVFWFISSSASAIALQASADRIFNREWYHALSNVKKVEKLKLKVKEEEEMEVPTSTTSSASLKEISSLSSSSAEGKSSNKLLEKKNKPTKILGKNSSSDSISAVETSSSSSSNNNNNNNSKIQTKTTTNELRQQVFAEAGTIEKLHQTLPPGADFNKRLHPTKNLHHSFYRLRNAFFEGSVTGAAGGVLAVFATYHAEIVATKCVEDYQSAMKKGTKRKYSSMIDCYFKTHQQSGISSLYFGVGPVFLRAAAFWGLTFGIRNALIELGGYVSPNDFIRVMKRQYYELPAVDETFTPPRPKNSEKDNSSWGNFISTQKKIKFADTELHICPIVLNAIFGSAAAAIARDLGAVFVRQAVTMKAAGSHIFSALYHASLQRQNKLAADAAAAATSSAAGEVTTSAAASAARSTTTSSPNASTMIREAFSYGRNVGSLVPRRLPFSCVRTGIFMALFDSFRCGHTRSWCFS